MNVTYKDAGVDLEVYRESMARLPKLMHRTFSPRVLKLDGGFAGLFRLDFQSPLFARNYTEPVLVSCTDGVGTKLKIAQRAGVHNTVGIDLVAMCVNDAICCGAEPLFFNDYIAMSRDDPAVVEQLVTGISDGCLDACCALNSGETAIMPDLYAADEYDLAGFCVGVVEQKNLITGSAITPGDAVIGLAATGLHSNGYSLVRRVVFEMQGHDIDEAIDDLGMPLGQALLTPTRIYVRPVRKVLEHYKVKNVVHGIAHITGGGLHENVARILPGHCRVEFQRGSWEIPAVFPWLQRSGGISDEEMFQVFNMGVGMVLIAAEYYADSIVGILAEAGVPAWRIGGVVEGQGDARWA